MEVEPIKQQLQKARKDREEFKEPYICTQVPAGDNVGHLARFLANHNQVMCPKLGLKFSTWRV
jgi:hypothetical protein